jgi:hypothetical protein
MHLKWRKQITIFNLRASTGFIVAPPAVYACPAVDFIAFRKIKAVDRRTSKELSLRATPASRALAIFNFGV